MLKSALASAAILVALWLAIASMAALAAPDSETVRIKDNAPFLDITEALVAIAPPRPDGQAGRVEMPERRSLPFDSPFAGWSSLSLKNETAEPADRLVVFAYPSLGRIGLGGARPADPKIVNVRHAQGALPIEFPSSGLANRFGMIGIRIGPGETHVIALQFEGGNHAVSAQLWKPEALQRYDTFLLLTIGLYWGVLLVGIALLFAMRLLSRKPGALAGGFFGLFALVFESASFGFGGAAWGLAFGPAAGEIAAYVRLVALVFTAFFGLLYLRRLLDLREEAPMADAGVRLVQYAVLLAVPLVFFEAIGPIAARAAAFLALATAGITVWNTRAFLPAALQLIPPGWILLFVAALGSIIVSVFGFSAASLVLEPLLHGFFVVGATLLILACAVHATEEASHIDFSGLQSVSAAARALAQPASSPAAAATPVQGLWDWSVATSKLYVSPSIEAMMGLAEGTLQPTEEAFAAQILDADRPSYRDGLTYYIDQGNSSFALEFRVATAEGGYRWLQLRATGLAGDDGRAQRVIGIVTDITEAKIAEEKLMRDASHDALTGVGNRALLLSHVDWAFANARKHPVMRPGTSTQLQPALLLLDIDRFKTINEDLGHSAGDQMLIEIARRMERALGPHDIIARIGSDEFAVLMLPGQTTDLKGAAPPMSDPDEMAALLGDLVSQPLMLDGQKVYPTASFGLARLGAHHKRGAELLADAEAALAAAKKRGGGEIHSLEAKPRPPQPSKVSLETDLRQAIERDQLLILYQPIIALKDRSVAGFEALLRWKHPARGLLAPKEFIPQAEDSGLIITLGRFALSTSAVQLAQWQTYFPLRLPLFMTVNVSSRQLLKPSFVKDVADVLASVKLAPESLKLEVTESMVFDDEMRVIKLLEDLCREGASLALDDYGTGYSSLSRLKTAPFSTVKIDRVFVAAMGDKGQSDAIVRSTIQMAHDMKLAVVAEGVEHEDQVASLAALGCDYAQGYLIGKPMSAGDALRFIASNWKLADEPAPRPKKQSARA